MRQTAQSCCVVKRDPLRRTVLLGSCRRASLGVNASPTLRRKAANLKRPRGLLSFCYTAAAASQTVPSVHTGRYHHPLINRSSYVHQLFSSCLVSEASTSITTGVGTQLVRLQARLIFQHYSKYNSIPNLIQGMEAAHSHWIL